jgi:hypothetical protein
MKSPDGDEKRVPHRGLYDLTPFYVLDALID